MKKSAGLVLLALVSAAGWFFFQNFEIKGLGNLQVGAREKIPSETEPQGALASNANGVIRVASFNIQVFGQSKLNKPVVMDRLAQIVRQFDIVAVQEVRSKNQDVLPRFIDLINAGGRRYDYVISERLGRTVSKEQYAYIFDTQKVEVDRNQCYVVADPNDVIHREPYVGWFRVRGPPPEQAWTFSLVNIHTDPDEVKDEIKYLDAIYREVRDDGRNEDDVIILGDFNIDDRGLIPQVQSAGLTPTISGVATNTRGTKLYDNLVFSTKATSEFTGRSGVYDFLREFNLPLPEAIEISDHLPVWAEFSVFEGGQPGRVATVPPTPSVDKASARK